MSWHLFKAEMAAYAQSKAPEEACGIITSDKFLPCKNEHPRPLESFAIGAKAFAKAEKRGIEAIFHSHLGMENYFSKHDIKSCKASNLPWVMYCTGTNSWHEMDPTGNAPYIGRPWLYGMYDCYGLVRDYYAREFGILLDDYERGDEFEWKSPEWRMFERNFTGQGFVDIGSSDLRKGDILLMQLQAGFANHVGVVHSPSQNLFYQHLLDRLSEASIYGGYWQKNTIKILRHKELS